MIFYAARQGFGNLFAPETRSAFWKVLGVTILVLIGLWFAVRGIFIWLALPWIDSLLPGVPEWAGWLSFVFAILAGLGLALASALLAAIFTVANSRLVQRIDAFTITFYEMAGATIFSFLLMGIFRGAGWAGNEPIWPSGQDWIWIMFLAFVCTVYASTMATQLMKQFSAYLVNLTVNLEPVYGIALAFFFFREKERMTSGFYWGTLLILMAVLLYPILSRSIFRPRQGKE